MKSLVPTSVPKQPGSPPGDNQYYQGLGLLSNDRLGTPIIVWFRFQRFGESDTVQSDTAFLVLKS